MYIKEFGFNYLEDLQHVLDHINMNDLQRTLELIVKVRDQNGTVWLIGNGGLASLAEHMAVDFQLAGVRAIALTQSAAITTYANDYNFTECFLEQIDRLADWDKDVIIAMSGSGNSRNIIEAWGHTKPCPTIGIGSNKGKLEQYCSLYLGLDTCHIGHAQDATQVILHILTYYLMSCKQNRQ